jgi:hypothetical protein
MEMGFKDMTNIVIIDNHYQSIIGEFFVAMVGIGRVLSLRKGSLYGNSG